MITCRQKVALMEAEIISDKSREYLTLISRSREVPTLVIEELSEMEESDKFPPGELMKTTTRIKYPAHPQVNIFAGDRIGN